MHCVNTSIISCCVWYIYIGYGNDDTLIHSPPLLFDVNRDPGESRPLSPLHYDHIITIMLQLASSHTSTVIPVADQLISRNTKYALCCNVLTDCVCDIEPPPPLPPIPPLITPLVSLLYDDAYAES